MTASTMNSAAAARASPATAGLPERCRQAANAAAPTTSPTTTAAQRWMTCGPSAAVSAGKAEPFMSGQSGNASAVPVAVTCEPSSIRPKTAAAASASTAPTPLGERGESAGRLDRSAR